ncbi:uncharacterized protein LOC117172571 isoform X2 [Belonocnema kinseyi]|uniref:uncharacterized protein LOC117172571 isoform X2 n=1 Tax=Belonocnema kinseyi TaxID=2817044 RepID=UPI00143DCE94|nr:uncharacterized protein LOC117172571 isoform X2 [Belonocnema kinseyi]
MGQGTESCTDRRTEVSVIRFVSRNHTIEEIVPKKEVYICKQRGCGKIFANQDEYKTHEILETLKIRFICREPGCGEELSDPGGMWRHYQQWHNESNVFICPYTSCSSTHMNSEYLKEHIDICHRQPLTLSTEPEIICFVEGTENAIEDDVIQKSEERYFETKEEDYHYSLDNLGPGKSEYSFRNNCYSIQDEQTKWRVATKAQKKEDYSLEGKQFKEQINYSTESLSRVCAKLPQNEDLLITNENFLMKYEARSSKSNENLQEKGSVIFVNDEVTIIKNTNSKKGRLSSSSRNHGIDLENFVKVFRNGFERENAKMDDIIVNTDIHFSNDEEYTPKKQRMSRYKEQTFRCEVNGCGKIYKYISHYRHHQDSHKLMTITDNLNLMSSRLKQGKASTVSFYQCKVYGCELEFGTSLMLCKHVYEDHSLSWDGANTKTGYVDSVRFSNQMIHQDTTTQKNFKTELKAKNSVNC